MTDPSEWRRIDHGANIGMTEGWVWLQTTRLQLHRILTEHNGQREIMDAHLFVMALRQVVRGVEMADKHVSTDKARGMIRQALADFEATIPGGKDARDVIEHFDEYTQGVGNLQHPDVRDRRKRVPDEQRAEAFRTQWDWQRTEEGWRPVLTVGPYPIDLINAEDAALRLHCALWEALRTDEGEPVPPGWAYWLNRPNGPRRPISLDAR